VGGDEAVDVNLMVVKTMVKTMVEVEEEQEVDVEVEVEVTHINCYLSRLADAMQAIVCL
jgi:hypothetical protein